MDISSQVIGLDDLNQQLQALTNLAGEKLKTQKATFDAAKVFQDEVKKQAPKAAATYYRYYSKRRHGSNNKKLMKPGTLKKSVSRKRVKFNNNIGTAIIIKSKAFYWRFIEYGTPNMPAVPFIRPSFELKKQEALDKFKERYRVYVQEIIERRRIEDMGTGADDAGE